MLAFIDDSISFGLQTFSPQKGELAASYFCKLSFKLSFGCPGIIEEPTALSGDRYTDEDASTGLYYASDFALYKPRAEATVLADAYGPSGQFDVKLKIGRVIDKTIRVNGNGDCLPITLAHAWGGSKSPENPEGCGLGNTQIPSLFYPQEKRSNYNEATRPACFSPLHPRRVSQQKFLGTFNREYLANRWPWWPNDFDYSYFQAAPDDQQVVGYFGGDELMELTRMHPVNSVYSASLPGVRVQCFVEDVATDGASHFHEIALNLDTLWIDMRTETGVLVWRGVGAVQALKLADSHRVLVIKKSMHESRITLDEAKAELELKLHPVSEPAPIPNVENDPDPFLEMQASLSSTEKEMAELESKSKTESFEILQTLGPIPGGADLDLTEFVTRDTDATDLDVESFQSIRQQLREADYNPSEEDGNVVAELQQAETSLNDFADEIKTMEAGFAEGGTSTSLNTSQLKDILSRNENVLHLSFDHKDFSGFDFSGKDLSGSSFRNARVSNCKFDRARLIGCDFSNAKAIGASFHSANLNDSSMFGCDLNNTVFTAASIENADFSEQNLEGINFSKSSGAGVDFSKSNLRGANFESSSLPGANFSDSFVDFAVFSRSILSRAQFEGASGNSVIMNHSVLIGLRCGNGTNFTKGIFRFAAASKSIFDKATVDDADFSGADLMQASFSEGSVKNAVFMCCDLTKSVFDDADLSDANFDRANLRKATFDRALLLRTELLGSNLYGCGFWDTRFDSTEAKGANVKGTILERR